jgi:diguanylate cyclase (GGDEF)-like protein
LHDGLTGLGNRQMFAVALAAQIDESLRDGQAFAMLYLDANGFKHINDKHGHSAGDIILKEIAARLRQSIRSSDIAFRLGGDEFAIILAPPADRIIAAHVAERIDLAMREPVALTDAVTMPISLSTGIAMYPEDGRTSNDLIETADALMYRNKRSQ